MSYIYGLANEKYVRFDLEQRTKKLKPLDTYKFKLHPLLSGQPKMKASEVSIPYKTAPDTLVELCSTKVNELPLPEPFKWRTLEVADWIRKLGLPQYQNTFRQNYINGRTLLRMDASYLTKINIRNFDHILIITNSIRKLYKFNKSSFTRSISKPDRTPDALYKFFRIRNGPKYERTRRTDLYRRLHLLRPPPLYETHWQKLERWLKHLRPIDTELIGRSIQMRNKLFCPPKEKRELFIGKMSLPDCECIPPCTCEWTDEKDLRKPWKLKCLNKLAVPEKRHSSCTSFDPCTCNWPKESNHDGINILKLHIPEKYDTNKIPEIEVNFRKLRYSRHKS